MPQLGETVTEGTITKWHKQVGDEVAEDEVLFEVSTDKVDSEVPCPVSGTVAEILVPEGDTVAVGTKLAVIGTGAGAAGAGAAGAGAAGAGPSAESVTGGGLQDEASPALVASEPRVPEPAAGSPIEPAPTVGATTVGASGSGADGGSARAGSGKLLSPVVRRLISENALDPAQIVGSGAGGRITRDDVLGAIERRGGAGNGSPAVQAEAPSVLGAGDGVGAGAPQGSALAQVPADQVPAAQVAAFPAPAAGERDTIVPFTNIRRRTAEHMVRSKHTSAHTMVAVEVDYSAVDRVRRAERERFRASEGFSLTYLPFIARAVVDALEQWPYLNSSVGDDELIVHGEVNLGVAVDLDFEGLLVPVVHRAEERRLVSLAREISALASRARAKRLTMDDISGGTFTITNAGGFGTFITVPVINQPQVAILSSDGVRKRPVAVELPDGSDGIAVHPVGNLVLSWDHRAVDGSYAAAFMARVRDVLQARDWAGEL